MADAEQAPSRKIDTEGANAPVVVRIADSDDTDTPEKAFAAAERAIAEAQARRATELRVQLRLLERLPPSIAGLVALQRLSLDRTRVADLAPIAGLAALQHLSLDGTRVADLAPIATFTGLADAAMLNEYDGLSAARSAAVADPRLARLIRFGNPKRTVDVLNVLRRENNLPPYYPAGYLEEPNGPDGNGTDGEIIIKQLPPPLAGGFDFAGGDDGPLRRVSAEPDAPIDQQRHLREELRWSVDHLIELCRRRPNQLKHLMDHGERFRTTLDGDWDAEALDIFWARGNTLRNLFEHDATERKKPDPDPAPYPADVAATLATVSGTFERITSRERGLRPHEQTIEPLITDEKAIGALKAAEALLDAAKENSRIVAPGELEDVEATASDAAGNTLSARRARAFTVRSALNLGLAIIKGAVSVAWKATAGTTIAVSVLNKIPEVVEFVARNRALLEELFSLLPGGDKVFRAIEYILKNWPF
ncbi:MAG: hypothetical protein SFW09_03725 [Hyphomicrobiaceae bacterium]|nr:hypothetical protein [Hyphomicrobiaceae bacterium]